jgi:hypothetical protein
MKSDKITPNDVLPGEILYADLHFINQKREKFVAKEQVISRDFDKEMQTTYTKDADYHSLNKWKIKQEKITLVNLNIKARLGFKNPPFNRHE